MLMLYYISINKSYIINNHAYIFINLYYAGACTANICLKIVGVCIIRTTRYANYHITFSVVKSKKGFVIPF